MAKTFSKLALSAAIAGLALGASAQQLEEVVVTVGTLVTVNDLDDVGTAFDDLVEIALRVGVPACLQHLVADDALPAN